MKLSRPKPVVIERADGRCYRLPPPTRGQVAAALELEQEEAEGPDALGLRISAQIRALGAGTSPEVDPRSGAPIADAPALPLDELTGDEEREILHALIAMHGGLDPHRSVAISRVLKKNGILAALETGSSSASTPTA